MRNLLLLDSVVARAMTEGIGTSIDQLPVSVNAEQIGSANAQTWSQRLLPLLLIMSIVLGGSFSRPHRCSMRKGIVPWSP